MRDVDAIVIGSGQGGVPLAVALAAEKKSVIIFERAELGGTCVNAGCTPSKAFLAAAHNVGRARRATALGLRGDVHLDFPATMERVRKLIGEWRDGVRTRLEAAGVEVVHAEASFAAPKVVSAGNELYRAPLIVIDTGARAVIPPIPGLSAVPYLDNVSFFNQYALPKHLLVLGAGYIGLELGQGMARAGSTVTIADASDHILGLEEPDAGAVLADALRADGIHLRLGVQALQVTRRGEGIEVAFSDGSMCTADAILVAVGRRAATAALFLERSGIARDQRGTITVDEHLQTTCEGVYAIGDVAGQPAFTHVSWEDYRRVLATLHGTPRRRDDRLLAYSTFTDPQVARAGLTLEQAEAKGHRATAVTLPLANVARGIEWNEERGFFRMVVDDDDDRILGATFVGYEAGELIHVMIALIDRGATWQHLADAMFVHPTFAEGLPTLARLVPDARAAKR